MPAPAPAFRPRFEPLEDRAVPAAGDLDLSFNGTGYNAHRVGPSYSSANDLAIQPDGKIVAAGSGNMGRSYYDLAVTRYRADGTLDPAFGSGGVVTTDISRRSDSATSVALQPDGKIVVGGISTIYSTTGYDGQAVLARYLADGRLDTSFGSRGLVVKDLFRLSKASPYSDYEEIADVAVQADGKIVAVGSYRQTGIVFRYNANGTPDTSFSGDGYAEFPGLNLKNVALRPGGVIVAGGDQGVIRVQSNGTLDPAFGSGGMAATAARTMAVRTDGRIVVGAFGIGKQLAQLNADGTPDLTFGDDADGNGAPDGFTRLPDAGIMALTVDSAGRIVGGGFHQPTDGEPPRSSAVFRLTPAGVMDTSFGTAGVTVTPFADNGIDEWYDAVSLQPDGRIVTAGYVQFPSGGGHTTVARYLSDDPPPAMSIAPPWDLDPDADDPWDVTAPFVG